MSERIKLTSLPKGLSDEYEDIPPRIFSSLVNWIRFADRPGHFLTCVLRNDLKGACQYADSESLAALKPIVMFLSSKMPGCWGSEEIMQKWEEQGGFRGFDW